MNRVSVYKTNTSIMLCEYTQHGHECDNPQETPFTIYKHLSGKKWDPYVWFF